jgi:glycosyltransferase involved in cell wall biosynthesis
MISVVIPTYNRRVLVVDAVKSVLAQEGCEFEVIVVDDGSTDGTADVLASLPGVRFLLQPRQGVAAARNAGARVARGEWLAFLDSDDLWRPGKLAAQTRLHADRPEIPISQTEEIWIRHGVRVNPCTYHRKPAGDIFLPSLARCLVSPSAVMLRRELLESVGGFDESLKVCEDYDLWLRLASRVRFGLVSEPLVIKRGGHADQLSRSVWGLDRFRIAALLKLLSTGAVSGERRRAVVETLQAKCAIVANGARRRGRDSEAERYQHLALCYGAAVAGSDG